MKAEMLGAKDGSMQRKLRLVDQKRQLEELAKQVKETKERRNKLKEQAELEVMREHQTMYGEAGIG